ncbi:hypothetical protein [Actinosynnema sp. NPDC020468]|uniref:hypothetical protein n=1 Tax=Actinosynnema sp. NPDC020468 TaxID=3154488 RepID=UPI0033D07ECC
MSVVGEDWTRRCLARADRRAAAFVGSAVVAGVVVWLASGWLGSRWVLLLLPLCLEFAVPGLRHLAGRRAVRRLLGSYPWHAEAVTFVPGRTRVGRQAFLEAAGSDRTFLRLPEMPERVREYVRRYGQVWLAGPDARGRVVVLTRGMPFLILGRVVIR